MTKKDAGSTVSFSLKKSRRSVLYRLLKVKVITMEEWTYANWEAAATKERISAFYLYTPLCGTCAVATKMLSVVHELKPQVPMGKTNLNYMEELATEYEIESVPCLLIRRKGMPIEKVYAFQSVQNILEKLS